jgi:hypothetical protein
VNSQGFQRSEKKGLMLVLMATGSRRAPKQLPSALHRWLVRRCAQQGDCHGFAAQYAGLKDVKELKQELRAKTPKTDALSSELSTRTNIGILGLF